MKSKEEHMHLILDTDIGSDVDDALALALIEGSPELELDAVITVYGNTHLRAQLARRYLSFTSADPALPIAAGSAETRSGKEVWWAGHEGGLFPDLETEQVDDNGVELLVRTLAANPGQVDVLAIGPLTNIAAALDADPAFEANVRRLVIMGGDFREDRIPEHNLESDISAAERVFGSGLEIVVGGLDLTLKVKMGKTELKKIEESGPLGELLAKETAIWWDFIDEQENSLHDPILALWIARPDLYTSTRARVELLPDGQTIAHPDVNGTVTILDAPDPLAVRDEIVRRIIAGAANSNRK
jgi:purine nucleosidase